MADVIPAVTYPFPNSVPPEQGAPVDGFNFPPSQGTAKTGAYG